MENKIQEFISEVISHKTEQLKQENFSKSRRERQKSISEKINPFLNQLPYIFTGIVESIFLNKKKQKKIRKYGCGLVINNNKVLVSSNNLVVEADEGDSSSDYELSAISFELINISEKYRKMFPTRFRAENYYYPKEREDSELNDETDKIAFGWGIFSLDYPIGEIIRYVVDSEAQARRELSKFSYIRCSKSVSDNELNNLLFLECKRIETTDIPDANDSIETYAFVKNEYQIKYDDRMLYLSKQGVIEDDILPGPILSFDTRHYYLVGFNTTNIDAQEAEEEVENIDRIALRFNERVISKLRENSPNLKTSEYLFSPKIFSYLTKSVKTESDFYSLLDNECHCLYLLRLQLLNKLQLDSEEKASIEEIDSNSFKMLLSFVWQSVTDPKQLKIDSIELDPVSMGIITELVRNTQQIRHFTLTNCSINTEGIKNFCRTLYDNGLLKQIFEKTKTIDLSFNKFDSKAMKYFKHVVEECVFLEELRLQNNFFNRKAIRYLITSLTNKQNLRLVDLENNCIGQNGAIYLRECLNNSNKLQFLNLGLCKIRDEGLVSLTKILKRQKDLTWLNLSRNDLTTNCGYYLKEIAVGCKKLQTLLLDWNELDDESIEGMVEGFEASECLSELSLAGNSIGETGAKSLAESLKNVSTLISLNLYGNKLGNEGMKYVNLILSYNKNLEELNIGGNNVSDEGLEDFIEAVPTATSLRNFGVHNNMLTELGCQILLELLLEMSNIEKINVEKNNHDFGGSRLSWRSVRPDVTIFY